MCNCNRNKISLASIIIAALVLLSLLLLLLVNSETPPTTPPPAGLAADTPPTTAVTGKVVTCLYCVVLGRTVNVVFNLQTAIGSVIIYRNQ